MPQSTYSLAFDGSTGYVDCGSFAALRSQGEFSVSFWAKIVSGTSGGLQATVIACGSSNQLDPFGFEFVGGVDLTWYLAGFAGPKIASYPVGDGLWHHIAAVLSASGGVWAIYLDGTLAQDVGAGSNYASGSGTGHLYLGGNSSDRNCHCNLDDVAVFDVALTSGQIAGLAAGTTDPATLSPVGLWRMEEGMGITAGDSSGNGNDGTLSNIAGVLVGIAWSTDVPSQLQGGGVPIGVAYYYGMAGALGGQGF